MVVVVAVAVAVAVRVVRVVVGTAAVGGEEVRAVLVVGGEALEHVHVDVVQVEGVGVVGEGH